MKNLLLKARTEGWKTMDVGLRTHVRGC